MIFCFSELKSKEVIDINTGERLGTIDDVRLDTETGLVSELLIYGGYRFFGLFGRENDTGIPCSAVKIVGEDVILVDADWTMCTKPRRKLFAGLFE